MGWGHSRRFVAVRYRLAEEPSNQYQLFATEQWKYRVFVTNRKEDKRAICREYEGRATAENYIKEGCNDAGFAVLSGRCFEANQNYLQGGILISHRLRTDLRWLGEDHAFSQRLRYRLMVEKEWTVGRWSFVPYANAEPYYDSRYNIVNRTRWSGGASVAWSPRFAVETNWTYQHDTCFSVTNLNALNVILHVFFETRYAK